MQIIRMTIGGIKEALTTEYKIQKWNWLLDTVKRQYVDAEDGQKKVVITVEAKDERDEQIWLVDFYRLCVTVMQDNWIVRNGPLFKDVGGYRGWIIITINEMIDWDILVENYKENEKRMSKIKEEVIL